MWLFNLFKIKSNSNQVKKFLIVGLGNIGKEYLETRHNIGFTILDYLIKKQGLTFNEVKYAFRASFKFKGKKFICIKPTTYMNLSGKAVNYWMRKEKINLENVLIITDDLNIPFSQLRLRAKGSSGGHNGLKNIEENLKTLNYSRLRFGIGREKKSSQIDFVLGKWGKKEKPTLENFIIKCSEIILSFGTDGSQNTMNKYNTKI
jgi:PTH1 family peptidyl-tRNA hydrolase